MSNALKLAALAAAASMTLAGGQAYAAGSAHQTGAMPPVHLAAQTGAKAPVQLAAQTGAKAPVHVAAMSTEKTPMVGGAPMYPDRTIVENAATAKNLTTLVSAVKEAGLADTLSGKGPFTVFAPTNEAFAKLPKATVNDLMKPANKDKLAGILTYHVVPGRITAKDLSADIEKGGGKASLKTVEGKTLTVTQKAGAFRIEDAAGHSASVEQTDVLQSNGVVYVIGSVLMPS